MKKPLTARRKVRLDFRPAAELQHVVAPIRHDLSTVCFDGTCLWLASDEGATLERLAPLDGGGFGRHRSFAVGDCVNLPDGPTGEADIEGLAVDGGYLWVVGSHSLKRKRPKLSGTDTRSALDRLTMVTTDANRYLLARLPLVRGVDGLLEPKEGAGAALRMRKSGANSLTRALRDDVHFGRFLSIPAKENGFDVEGIAVSGNRVFLGLRGPVLRGWASIIELEVHTHPDDPGRLKLARIGEDQSKVCKHFLDLDGLGIRELALQGDDILILAGPTMDLSKPARLYRWPNALGQREATIVPHDRLVCLANLPAGEGYDHPEGIALLPYGEGSDADHLLVVYDSPGPARLHQDDRGIDADLFRLP